LAVDEPDDCKRIVALCERHEPSVAYLFYHLWNGLFLLVVGEYFCWRLGRRALTNAPRDYAPDRLPEELLT